MGGYHLGIHPICNAVVALGMEVSTLEMTNDLLREATLILSLFIAILGFVKAIKEQIKKK